MKASLRLLLCVTMALVAVLPAAAQGILFVEKETRDGNVTTNRIQIDKNYMRSESVSGGEQVAFVFDGPKQIVRTINLSRKTYMEISKAELDQMRGQMAGMMAQMEAQLRGMPPEQRQAVEQMMKARGGMLASAAPKVQYRQAGSDKVANWTCTKYEGYVGQQKTSEVCTVDPKTFNLVAADFEIAQQMAEFAQSLAPDRADSMIVSGTLADQGYSGIVVKRTAFRNNAVESVKELTEFRRESFPASTFEVPAGFRREEMPGMRR